MVISELRLDDDSWVELAFGLACQTFQFQSPAGYSWRMTAEELLIIVPARIEVIGGAEARSSIR